MAKVTHLYSRTKRQRWHDVVEKKLGVQGYDYVDSLLTVIAIDPTAGSIDEQVKKLKSIYRNDYKLNIKLMNIVEKLAREFNNE